jgi:uncharacterized protein YjbI with pentapeptide repeats
MLRRDFKWTKIKQRLRQLAAFPAALAIFLLWPLLPIRKWGIDWPRFQQQREFRRLCLQGIPAVACLMFVLISLSLATFPGEWHVNLVRGKQVSSVLCDNLLPGTSGRWLFYAYFDRLDLPRVDVVDDEKLAKIEDATSKRNLPAHDGERTRNLRDRDLNCSDLSNADLRRVDLTGARLSQANLNFSALQGASLDHAQLQGASFEYAGLQGASLTFAELQGATFLWAKLQGASLEYAQIQDASFHHSDLQAASLIGARAGGAFLESANLQGASLDGASLRGASLKYASLQGVSLNGTGLQGASLQNAMLQGASLHNTRLQGASLDEAQLQGAHLFRAQVQGANFNNTSMSHTLFEAVYVWRARNANCRESRVHNPKSDPMVEVNPRYGRLRATSDEIVKFIERSVADIPEVVGKKKHASGSKLH